MFLIGPIGPTEIMLILILIVPYFVPSIIAIARKHYNPLAIFILNLFLGWTIIGWIAALVWSFSATQRSQVTTTTPSEMQRKTAKQFCSKCGTPLESGDVFCSKCGNKI